MNIANIISLFGGISMFLFGMLVMGEGLKKVAGAKLELVLYKLTNSPLKGVLLGTGVTAVIQSSSATSVMVVGFVNSGIMKVRQAIGIVLGSILGTSITGWIICLSSLGNSGWTALLSTAVITGVVAVIGIIMRMFVKKAAYNHLGDILLGFSVLMYGMSIMSGAVEGEGELFKTILTAFSNPLLGILIGVAFAAILQSASAAVGILQALAATGAVTFDIALPIILGIAIGAAVPVLLSALGANNNGKKTAFVYLAINLFGVIICGSVFYLINSFVHFEIMNGYRMTSVTVALLNTVFRLTAVAVLTPLIPLLEKIVDTIFREKPMMHIFHDTDSLEERFLIHPTLAIEQSRRVTNRMAEKAQKNLFDAMALIERYSDTGYAAVDALESDVDKYEDKLGTYLMKITGRELNKKQSEEVSKFLHTISDFERISDHASNIADVAKEINQKKAQFSHNAAHEIEVIKAAVSEIVNISIKSFIDEDLKLAGRVEPLEEIIDGLCDEMKLHHVDRLQNGECTLEQGFVFNDLLTNFERVADHCSNIAVAIIEIESDTFDTHEYLSSVKKMKSDLFEKYYEEYKEKYAI